MHLGMAVGEGKPAIFLTMIRGGHVVPVASTAGRDTTRRQGKHAIVGMGAATRIAGIGVGINKDPERAWGRYLGHFHGVCKIYALGCGPAC